MLQIKFKFKIKFLPMITVASIIAITFLFEELYRKSCQQAKKSNQATIRPEIAKTLFSQR